MDVCQALEPQVDTTPLVRTLPHIHRSPLMPTSCGWTGFPTLPLALRSAEGSPHPCTGWMDVGVHVPLVGMLLPLPLQQPRALPLQHVTITAGGMELLPSSILPWACCSCLPEQGTQFFSSPAFHLFSTFTSSNPPHPIKKEGKKTVKRRAECQASSSQRLPLSTELFTPKHQSGRRFADRPLPC